MKKSRVILFAMIVAGAAAIAVLKWWSHRWVVWEQQLVSRKLVEGYRPVLEDFFQEEGRFPSGGEGLRVLADRQYVGEKNLSDLWGQPLVYRIIDAHAVTVTSLGADGLPGGTGWDEDITVTVNGTLTTTLPTTTRGTP